MKIPGKRPIQTIIKKLPQDLNSLNIGNFSELLNNNSTENIVSLDTNELLYKKSSKSFSIKFLNYIEPYLIKGQRYTLFYTQVETNLKIGDRIFLVGGNYDSDLIIKNNKFNKKSDGYIVQYVDKTKVVLDIEYTGVLPWFEKSIDNFIKIYVASSQDEFNYFIQNVSTETSSITNRFSYSGTYSNNNILYINGTFSLVGDYGIIGFTNSGSYSMTYSNSFLILNGTISGYLEDITYDILNGTYSTYTNNNNNNIKIINNDFDISTNKFKETISTILI